jgi:hypothetical protein
VTCFLPLAPGHSRYAESVHTQFELKVQEGSALALSTFEFTRQLQRPGLAAAYSMRGLAVRL